MLQKLNEVKIDELRFVSNLCELFAEIDVNGDGSLEWTEFTSFIVESGAASKKHRVDAIQKFSYVDSIDFGKPTGGVEKLVYFRENETIVSIDYDSSDCYVYSSSLALRFKLSRAASDGLIRCVGYLSKKAQYVITSSDSTMSFYDAQNGMLVKSFRTTTVQICLEWVAEYGLLYTGDMSGTIRAWDVDAMEEKFHMGGSSAEVGTKAWSNERTNNVVGHQDSVMCLLRLHGMDIIASASMDSFIYLWDMTTGHRRRVLAGHRKGVTCLAYIPDQRFLVSAGYEFDVLIWNPYVQQLVSRISGHMHSICGVKIIAGTPQLITADTGSVVKVWDVRDFTCVQTLVGEEKWVSSKNAPKFSVSSLMVIDKEKKMALACGTAHFFESQKLENPELTDDAPIIYAAYNPTTLSFISVSSNEIKIWNAKNGSMQRSYKRLGGDADNVELTTVCLDDRQRKIIIGDHIGFVGVYDYLNGADLKWFNYTDHSRPGPDRAHGQVVSSLVYCSDHKVVISASWDRTVCVHDERVADTGILLRTMTGGHAADITTLAYSRYLSMIASGSSDGYICLWDFEFGRLNGTCEHYSSVTCVEFMDPFPMLVSSHADGTVCIWTTQSELQQKASCRCVASWQNRNRVRAGEDAVGTSVSALCVHVAYDQSDEAKLEFISERKREQSLWSAFDATRHLSLSSIQDSSLLRSQLTPTEFDIITGDEEGQMSIWNVKQILPILEDRHAINALNTPNECFNPRRSIKVDASENLKSKRGNVRLKKLHGSKNIVTLEATRSWKAHGEIISSLQRIVDPPGLISGSFDRLVKVWNYYGECLGTLSQGSSLNSWGSQWKFEVDLKAVYKRQMEIAEAVSREVRDMELTMARKQDSQAKQEPDFDQDLFPFESHSLDDLDVDGGDNRRRYVGGTRRTESMRPIDARSAGKGISKRRIRKNKEAK